MMRFLQKTLIFGEGAEAAAFSALLRLLAPEIFCFELNQLEATLKEFAAAACETLVVILASQRDDVSFTSFSINPIMLLRYKLKWRGAALFIADSAQLHHWRKSTLFDWRQGPRHSAQIGLERPVTVGKLCGALARLRPYSESAWQAVQRTVRHRSIIKNAATLSRQIKHELAQQRWPEELFKEWLQVLAGMPERDKILLGHDNRHALADWWRKYQNPMQWHEVSHEARKEAIALFRKVVPGIPPVD